MDGLSLLCNLHADGPLALRRLRAAGVQDLGAIARLPEATLVACLRSTAGHARRFVEEGRQLARRLAESPLEPDEHQPPAEIHASVEEREQPAASRPLTWRASPSSRAAHDAGDSHPLEAGALSGLDARTCERLAAQEVRTLEALRERASLALARSAGIPLHRLLDLATEARLVLTDAGPRSAEVVPEPRRHAPALARRSLDAPPALPVAKPAYLQVHDPGVAGPFG